MEWKNRTEAPSTTDKNYIKTTYGGNNYCIVIDSKTGSCLPNCVGYCWGRWMEMLGVKYHNLSRANAENWYLNTGDGYKRGKTPKLGAVACWRKGKAGYAADGAGHVAIVEDYDDNSITVTQSSYGGKRWERKKFYKNEYGNYVINGLNFQGFIYPPVEFVNGSSTEDTTDGLKVGDTVIITMAGNAQANGKGRKAGGVGWEREIMSIKDGAEYPYKVGKDGVATGWYKRECLKLK